MATATLNTSTFPLFSTLAPELRNQIWNDALPEKIGPGLYLYKRGCWRPRRLLSSDEGYDPENDEHNLNFEFRHDLLDGVRFEVPLLLVNREAHGIAAAWVRAQGIEIQPCKHTKYPVFVRPFNPSSDALYIPLQEWDEFLCEPDDRLSQPDLLEQLVDNKSDIRRIAVPETLLRSEGATLSEMFHHYFNLEELLIVVDAKPDLQPRENDMKLQWPREFESTQEGMFFWDNERGGFDLKEGEVKGHEALYKFIEEVKGGLGEGLMRNHIRSFEIRPVYAVRS